MKIHILILSKRNFVANVRLPSNGKFMKLTVVLASKHRRNAWIGPKKMDTKTRDVFFANDKNMVELIFSN